MRVHALQVATVWQDHDATRRLIEARCDNAAFSEGDYVVLGELCETGFSMNTDVVCRADSPAWAAQLARRHRVWLQFGCALRERGRVSNAAVVFAPDGVIAAVYRKCMLFTPGGEQNAYTAGGDPIIVDTGRMKVAPMICYDLRFPELWRRATLAGAELLAIGACWPARRAHHWGSLLIARAIENQAWVVAANSCGTEPTGPCAGESQIITHDGAVVSVIRSGDGVASADLDLDALRRWRQGFPALRDARRAHLGLS